MRLDRRTLVTGGEGMLSAIALGQPLAPALDAFAKASGSHSACLWRSKAFDISFVGNASFDHGMAQANRPGDEPWHPSAVIPAGPGEGFVANTDERMFPRLRRLGFYQDVMRDNDFHWYAGLHLGTRGGVNTLLGVWRSEAEGRIEYDDLAALDVVARDMRVAFAFADRLGGKDEERDAARFIDRGEAVLRVDALGLTTPANDAAQVLLSAGPFRLAGGRLATSRAPETECIAAILGAAAAKPGSPGSALVTCPATGRRWQLLALPVVGEALDVFGATRAIVAVIDLDARPRGDRRGERFLREGFHLTGREAAVAGLVAQGMAPAEIATTLEIGEGTTRNHLKRAMHKIGVTSQIQLAALVARYG